MKKFLKIKKKEKISVLTLQIKILMMKILWMVIDLLPPALHRPKLQQVHGETLEWGPPGGSAPPLSDPSLQVGPGPSAVLRGPRCRCLKQVRLLLALCVLSGRSVSVASVSAPSPR